MLRLAGKRALVTGGSRGIGRAVALRLATEGADVAITYATQKDRAAETVAGIKGLGRRAFALVADVGRLDTIPDIFDRVAREWGGLDIYVNNAIDVAAFGPIRGQRIDAWRHTIDSHVTAFLVAARCAVPLMHDGGAMVALSSAGARVVLPNYAAVGVGKAAVEALTRYLAVELAPHGIRVNVVSAGPIDTDSLRRLRQFDAIRDAAVGSVPGRLGVPEDVAPVVAFLCSPDAAWLQGQVIIVDGGQSLTTSISHRSDLASSKELQHDRQHV